MNNEKHHMVDLNADFLPFPNDYQEMERVAGTSIMSIGYTQSRLTNVVASLSKPINKDKGFKDQARALIFMC